MVDDLGTVEGCLLIELLMAGALLTAPIPALADTPGQPAVRQDPTATRPSVELEDVEVTGRTLETMIRDFVVEVAEPNRDRALARWNGRVCIGVANLTGETARFIADRVSTVAEDIGLDVGPPGCTPNILVVATDDANALAQTLVRERRRAFRMGGPGMDRGGAALRDFTGTDRPVRWWQMSMPTDSETGDRAVRIPGDCTAACINAADFAPQIDVFAMSRLNTQIVENIVRTVVVVDVDQVAQLSVLQLADYIAMVSLAQIDPDADTGAYASILNVFNDPDGSRSLTDWDQAYLDGLYGAERNQANWRAGRNEIVNSIRRAHERLRDSDDPAAAAADN